MGLRRLVYLGGAFLLVLITFAIDVIGKNVELGVGGLSVLRHFLVGGAFVLLSLVLVGGIFRREQTPIKRLGFLLIVTIAISLLALVLSLAPAEGFDAKNLALIPLDYVTLFIASLLSLGFGLYGIIAIRLLSGLILASRKHGSVRNFTIFMGLLIAAAASTLMLRPLDSNVVNTIFFGLTVAFATANSFRLPWIVYLTKREKIFSLVAAFFLVVACLGLNMALAQNGLVGRSLLYYSYPLKEFVQLVMIFANIYCGMAFVSTLFHLPTAEAFDRKRSEVSSLHNLSKLVTQVFDFNELVDTVTSMTLQVCEAQSSWLEIIHMPEEAAVAPSSGTDLMRRDAGGGSYRVQVAGMKNITQQEIDVLLPTDERNLRDEVIQTSKPVIVDDLGRDPRFLRLRKSHGRIASETIAVVPLVSHVGLVGILYATKASAYGFEKDDVDVISAFADQATVAIENSRLIKKSIERERLLREMMLAQEMQKKLLPQHVPSFPTLEIDAVSTPAFEVGGDYYDFMQLGPDRIGIVVGDVSGKGVSAAFYMAEVKGIFQSLSRMYSSPKEFMIKANEALAGSIDKHSFVSLIYAIVDVTSGNLILSRAGHCPMLLLSGDSVQYIRPNGMGMGLDDGPLFDEAIEEKAITLKGGDVCIFYTDGVTEAQRGDDEFGYDRLVAAAQKARGLSASGIKSEILETVKAFIEHKPNHDDLTLVVLKWRGLGDTY